MRKYLIAASFLGFIACDKPASTATTTPVADAGNARAADGTTTRTTAVAGGDSEIYANIVAVNKAEIAQANAAMPKLTNSGAKDFAEDMVKAHTEALEKLNKVATEQHIAAVDDASTAALKDDSAAVVTKLGADASGPLYDRTYMQSQIDAHTKALKLLDEKLIPGTKNAELKTTLTDLREHVAHHLSKAQDVFAKLPQGV